ncbi:DUF3857 domain-containing protein [Hugenholtzia roseola]|uniref:DUF3857 domain-containing protein n=1 Tax=Hugenholtzia roseola TaxID=1002 RepID=UPI000421C1C4|nr:DUF3857 domain-containing protein [Hugenholtzia roseola]
MRFLYVFCSLLLWLPIQAQETAKFGKVAKEEFALSSPENPEAEGIVLFDVGKTYVEYSSSKNTFVVRQERHKRIKINTTEALSYANVTVDLYNPKSNEGKEIVTGLRASTYHLENGKVVTTKMGKENIFEEAINDNWTRKKFTLENVKAGAIIEYEYTLQSDFLYELPAWNFQDEIPTLFSECIVHFPEYYNYQIHFTGYEQLFKSERSTQNKTLNLTGIQRQATAIGAGAASSEQVNYLQVIQHLAAKNMPAFKMERFMTTARDYITRVEFELYSVQFNNQPMRQMSTSWENIGNRLFDEPRFGEELNRKGEVKEIALQKIGEAKDNRSKVAALLEILAPIKWNGEYKLLASKNIKQTLQNKEGNSADLNLLLIALCRAVDINAYPVILSTRSHGRLREQAPSLSKLNHVIAQIEIGEGETIWVDAIDKTLPLGLVSYPCLNTVGYVLKDRKKVEKVDLQAARKNKFTAMSTLQITPEGQLKADLSYLLTDYSASQQREAFAKSKDETDYMAQIWKPAEKNLTLSNFEISQAAEIEKPLLLKVTALHNEQVGGGDMIYISPFIDKVFEKNPFVAPARKYPVDFAYPTQESYVVNLEIPKGYAVEALPENEKIALPQNSAVFSFVVTPQEGKIQIVCNYQINKILFQSDEYALLRDLIAKVIAKQEEKIILKKI